MNTSFPMTAEQWRAGLTLDAYLAGMKMYQAEMARRLASVALTTEQRAAFTHRAETAHVLVMTEDWCGDALMNTPIAARIVEALPAADLRVFVRKSAPELKAHYADRGITSILVVTFLDPDFRELATWVERPQTAGAVLAAWLAAHPDFDITRRVADMTAEEREAWQARVLELMVAIERWYDDGLQADTVAEILTLLNHRPEAAS